MNSGRAVVAIIGTFASGLPSAPDGGFSSVASTGGASTGLPAEYLRHSPELPEETDNPLGHEQRDEDEHRAEQQGHKSG